MYNMIDQNDITVQVESGAVDVWVPDALAVYKRDVDSDGVRVIELVPGAGIVTSLDPSVKPEVSGGNTIYKWDKSKTKSRFLDAVLNGSQTAVDTTRGQEIGPILLQNRVPIPVRDGSLVKYSGTIRIRRCGMQQKDIGGNANTAVIIRIMLTAVGYIQDEYGDETSVKFDLMRWTKTLQAAGSGNPGTAFVDFTPDPFEWSALPAGTTQLFLSVTAHSANDMNQSTWEGGETRLQYQSGYWFVNDKDFMVLPGSDKLSIHLRQPRNEPYLYPHSLSSTGWTFRNRSVFTNLYPLFLEQDIANTEFNTTGGWDAITGTHTIDTANSVMKLPTNIASSVVRNTTSITAASGDMLYAEAYVKKSTAASGTLYLRFDTTTASGPGTTVTAAAKTYADISGTEYVKVSGKISAPVNTISAKLSITASNSSQATGDILIDSVSFSKIVDDNTITLMSYPNVAQTASIYEWNGNRGPLIKNVYLPANTRVSVPISSNTGQIEVAKVQSTSPDTQVDAGVKKTVDQGAFSINQWTQITGLSVDPQFLGTVLVSNSIKVPSTGKVAFFGSLCMQGTAGNFTMGWRVLVNGVVRADLTRKSSSNKHVIGTTSPISVNANDTVTFEGYSNSIYASRRTIDKSKTFFRMSYEPQPLTPSDIFVESVWANKWENLHQTQTRAVNRTYVDVHDDVSSIKVTSIESDTGVLTIKFCSDVLDPATNALLQIGKSIRVLGRHYGISNTTKPAGWTGEADYSVVFTGIIKRVEVTYDYKLEPQITVTAYNLFHRADNIFLGCAYNTMAQYAGPVNTLGSPVYIEGVEYTGAQRDIPQDSKFFPSTNGEYTLMDALTITRNTNKWFVSINNRDELILRSTLPNTVKAVFTDGTMPGDLSMSDVRMGADTDSIINIIEIEENLLDRKDFMERTASSETAPDTLKTVQGKKRTIQYISRDSIVRYGEFSKRFQVVRGTGTWEDLRNDNFGDTFENWAQSIIDSYAQPLINVSSIKVPIKNSKDIKLMSELEILDRVYVGYKGEYFDLRIKEIQHDITPGKWVVELRFQAKNDMTYWTGPDTATPES